MIKKLKPARNPKKLVDDEKYWGRLGKRTPYDFYLSDRLTYNHESTGEATFRVYKNVGHDLRALGITESDFRMPMIEKPSRAQNDMLPSLTDSQFWSSYKRGSPGLRAPGEFFKNVASRSSISGANTPLEAIHFTFKLYSESKVDLRAMGYREEDFLCL